MLSLELTTGGDSYNVSAEGGNDKSSSFRLWRIQSSIFITGLSGLGNVKQPECQR